jgi:hypothetical protein
LNWIFEQAEEAIVLEDDCVPDGSFFRFCEELLERYREDERIMHISGNNFQRGRRRGDASYYFSRFTHNWGWATWRRAWRFYDKDMSQLQDAAAQDMLRPILPNLLDHFYWTRMMTRNRSLSGQGRGPDWDTAWMLSCWLQGGLSILPNVNLVTNIGFDALGSHQFSRANRLMNIPTEEIRFPLSHPRQVVRNWAADAFTQRHVVVGGLFDRVMDRLARKR